MNSEPSPQRLVSLLHRLCALPKETEWVEFKQNFDPQETGKQISALANSVLLADKTSAYLVWGIRDSDHAIVGTTFNPSKKRVGGEELENWLLHLLEPHINFRFFTIATNQGPVVLMEIDPAAHRPVSFSGTEYIRIGSYTKKLKKYPEKERVLWRTFDRIRFERMVALEQAADEDVLKLLDYPAYFGLLGRPLPENRQGILEALAADDLIRHADAGGWDLTNLGAILFAKRLGDFRSLGRKAVRVIQYRENSRINTLREQEMTEGYACGFENMIRHILCLLPASEVIEGALRKTVSAFPGLAVRELVANAIIHQDFSITGAGPMVEIFSSRVEITNPGEPLVSTQRFLDATPRTRNEKISSLMRRFKICEEQDSGIDKVVLQVELSQLPAPLFEAPEGFTRTTLFSYKKLSDMNRQERIRACYLHACLFYVDGKSVTNTSIRERFGIAKKETSTASRLLSEAVGAGLIAVAESNGSRRHRRYLPFWASPESDT